MLHKLFWTVPLCLAACVTQRPYVAEKAVPEEQIFATVVPFYSWVLANRYVSMPTEKERSELANFLTPELIQLLKDTGEMEERCAMATPKGEKGPIFEGALFVGLYEGATEASYGDPKTKDGVVTLQVTLLHYIDENQPKASRYRMSAWSDKLELRQKDEKWLIHNIHFPHGNLRSTLQDYSCDRRY